MLASHVQLKRSPTVIPYYLQIEIYQESYDLSSSSSPSLIAFYSTLHWPSIVLSEFVPIVVVKPNFILIFAFTVYSMSPHPIPAFCGPQLHVVA